MIKPEISSFLKNQIIKEGESLELKCRLDEEIEPDDVTVTWWFNDNEIAESERIDMTFDGTYAKLFLAWWGTLPFSSYYNSIPQI